MANLADVIEQFILQKLSCEDDDIIILKRNELADELDCAPSQISYVLSTRFTIDRGYVVESRRGLGGFVRIVKLPVRKMVYGTIPEQDKMAVDTEYITAFLDKLNMQGMITNRETAIMKLFFDVLDNYINPQEKVDVLRSLLYTLAKNS